jgi:hypothetical protein
MTEADLLRKLSAIEALLQGAATPGENAAAEAAKHRLEARLAQLPPACQDFHFTIHDSSGRKLFGALAKKLGLEAFRYKGQRRTSLVVHCTAAKKDLLWDQFLQAHQILAQYLEEVTNRVIAQTLGQPDAEVAERAEQKVLPL